VLVQHTVACPARSLTAWGGKLSPKSSTSPLATHWYAHSPLCKNVTHWKIPLTYALTPVYHMHKCAPLEDSAHIYTNTHEYVHIPSTSASRTATHPPHPHMPAHYAHVRVVRMSLTNIIDSLGVARRIHCGKQPKHHHV